VNQELRALFDEDQADRRGEFPADLDERDQRRRRRVEQLLAEGTVVDPDDLFCAAMVFQHGADRPYYLRAHEPAKRAAELGSTRPRALAGRGRLRPLADDRWAAAEVRDPIPVRQGPLGPARGRPNDLGRGASPLGRPATGRGAAAGPTR
jgi:hypothetical protein